jgi:hypothetical protein
MTDALYLGSAIFVIGAAMGWWGCVLFTESQIRTVRDVHIREMDEIYEEVKRLRAQNAQLIGKE